MIAHAELPHLLAAINASTLMVLTLGYRRIRAGDRDGHRQAMTLAIGLGAAFLAIYLYYHLGAGLAKFGGVGLIRPFYFTLLIIHILMATVAALLVPLAIFQALAGRFEAHRRLARRALPIWAFVSASGLAVYAMAVHLFPFRAG